MNPTPFASLPTLGAPLGAGTFRGLLTQKDGTHVAIVELPDRLPHRLNKAAALAWVDEVGGQLPTRAAALLLYANAKEQFQPTTYWTGDLLQDDLPGAPLYTWAIGMDGGGLNYHPHEVELAVVAVQFVPVT